MRHVIEYDDRGEGRNAPKDVESYFDALDMDREGYVHFAVGIAFERAPNAFPKTRVATFLRVKTDGDAVDIQLLNRDWIAYAVSASDQQTYTELYDAMIELLEGSFRGFAPDPDNRLPSIGFDLTPPPPPQPE